MPINNELAHEQWSRFQFCRDNGHTDFVTKADMCDKFVVGDQWKQGDLIRLNEQQRPALTINKILPTVGTLLGEQIQNRTEVLFRPKNGAPSEVADALSKVWMQISQNNQLPWVRSEVFADGVIRSRGFYDVRMDFADAMQGEVRITQLNSKNVVIDPDAEEYDPDSWSDVFITKWMTYQDIATLYSEDDAEYLKDRDTGAVYGYDSIEQVRDSFAGMGNVGGDYDYGSTDKDGVRRNIRVLERQFRRLDNQLHFVDVVTGDTRPVPVDWDRNRIALLLEKAQGKLATMKKLTKRIRWAVTADNMVLHDEWSPYKHFTPVPYFPLFRYGRTVGVVENLIGSQEMLNKVSSQELHVINTTANSGWVIEENSLANMSIEELEVSGSTTGLVVEFRKGAQPPVKIQPNQTPTGLDRLSYKAEEHIKTISNVSDSMQGNDREDVAAKAIAYKQQRSSVNHTKVVDNLERTDWLLARNVLDLVQSYYSEERQIDITHDDVTREQEQIMVNQMDPVTGTISNDLTIGEYDIVITSTPFRNSLEDSQFEQARALRELGVQIPDSVLIENSRLMRRGEIVKQIEAAKTSPEAQAQAEMQQRAQAAEVAKLEAEAQKTGADAQKSMADTQLKTQEAQSSPEQLEMAKMQAELEMEERRLQMEMEAKQAELAFKREELEMKMQLEREKHAQDMQIKQQQAQQDAVIKQQQAEQQAAAQRAQTLREGESQTAEPTYSKE
jgi:hypothetical protein